MKVNELVSVAVNLKAEFLALKFGFLTAHVIRSSEPEDLTSSQHPRRNDPSKLPVFNNYIPHLSPPRRHYDLSYTEPPVVSNYLHIHHNVRTIRCFPTKVARASLGTNGSIHHCRRHRILGSLARTERSSEHRGIPQRPTKPQR